MDGVVIIDKPEGWTSHDVVARVRRVLKEKRVGHTGTLDPFATGVLVVLVGRATRLAQFLAGAEKEYEAVIRLGYATDTGDLTGTPLLAAGHSVEAAEQNVESARATSCASWSDAEIEGALRSLRGDIEQVPPMYSAKKVKGEKLYELARRGEVIERKAVRITVREFEAVRHEDGTLVRQNETGTCDVRARVVCAAGTYVRVLAESVGERLGAGAHLAALRRTRAGAFRIESATALDELPSLVEAGASVKFFLSPNAALPSMPVVHLTDAEARAARHGMAVKTTAAVPPEWADGAHVRMCDAGENLVAVGVYEAEREVVRPRVVLAAE